MKHYIMTAAMLSMSLATTPVMAVELVQKCLVGKWVPDYKKEGRRIMKLSDAPKNKVSGSIVMIIKGNGLSEFRVKNWSLLKAYSGQDPQELLVSGVAKFTVSAPHGGEFHFAEQSNTYKQQIITHHGDYDTSVDLDPIREMLPMGKYAHGTLKCDAKTVKLTVTSKQADETIFTLWHRK